MVIDNQVVIPENLILYANKHGWTPQLALYIEYKRVFRSAHFHSKQVPDGLNVSRSSFHNHIEKFIELGWAERLATGFRLISVYKLSKHLKTLHRDYKCTKRHYLTETSKSDLVSGLRYITFKRHKQQIDFATTAKKLDITYTRSSKRNKLAEKLINDGLSGNVAISIKTIGKTWNMSSATGHRYKRRWLAEGNINVTSQQPNLYQTNVSYSEWKRFLKTEDYNQTYFHSGTNIWQSQSDKIHCYV